MSEPPAVLHYGGTETELPVIVGTENEHAIDIAKLRNQTGLITLDYGYMNTGSTESAITYIDGDVGILRYRGYPIEQLADHEEPSFLETSYLLIYGELPTISERDEVSKSIRKHTLLHEDVKRFFDGFPKDAQPMAILSAVVASLADWVDLDGCLLLADDPFEGLELDADHRWILPRRPGLGLTRKTS